MCRYGNVIHGRTRFDQAPSSGHNQLVDVHFRARRTKSFADNAYLQAIDALADEFAVWFCLQGSDLPRVESIVIACNDFEQQGAIGARCGHRAEVIDGVLDRTGAGIGHKAIGRLDADAAGPRTRHAYRTTLIAADRHIAFAGHDQRRAAAR